MGLSAQSRERSMVLVNLVVEGPTPDVMRELADKVACQLDQWRRIEDQEAAAKAPKPSLEVQIVAARQQAEQCSRRADQAEKQAAAAGDRMARLETALARVVLHTKSGDKARDAALKGLADGLWLTRSEDAAEADLGDEL